MIGALRRYESSFRSRGKSPKILDLRSVRDGSPKHTAHQEAPVRNTFFATALFTALAGSALTSACSGDIGKLPFDTGGSGGAGAGSGANGGNGGSGGDPIENPQFAPAPGGIRRLLGRQYVNSIRLVLGDAAASKALPPVDATLSEFESLAAAEQSPPPTAIEAYEASAREVAHAAVLDTAAMAKLVPCVPLAEDDAECHKQTIENVGHQLWRRPLTPEEVTPMVAIAQEAGLEYGNFIYGVEYALLTMLQSPYFLYTVEVGVPDDEHPEWRKLTGPELATRMSLFLLDSIPDAPLLEAAETGSLETQDQVRDAARDLLTRAEARTAITTFYDVLYKLRDLPTTTKDAALFPEFTPALGDSMRQETLRFFEDVIFDQNADYRTIFSADYTFMDANVAAMYGVPAPAGGGFQKVNFPSGQMRKGFLGHPSHLTRNGHSAQTSPTRRGVFLSNFLLCSEIPPPPPGVNTSFPPYDPNKPQTKKEYLMAIHWNGADDCKGCHTLMDPLGFAMESYDTLGRFRTEDENGLPIDPSGEMPSFGTFANMEEAAELMYDDPRAMSCIVSNLFRQSMGHKETKGERPAILAIQSAFESSGYKLQDAIVELVASPAFNYVDDPK